MTSALSQQLPGFSSQFRAAPASSPYLYETRFQFTNLGTFYGSSYFLNQVGQQAATLPKSLGDAYMDTQLISNAVLQQTGKKFLSSSYSSASDQMQALIAPSIPVLSHCEFGPGGQMSFVLNLVPICLKSAAALY